MHGTRIPLSSEQTIASSDTVMILLTTSPVNVEYLVVAVAFFFFLVTRYCYDYHDLVAALLVLVNVVAVFLFPLVCSSSSAT